MDSRFRKEYEKASNTIWVSAFELLRITLSTFYTNKLKTECESQFTNKLERTFKDIIQSEYHHQQLFQIQHQEQQTKYQISIVTVEYIFNENDCFSH